MRARSSVTVALGRAVPRPFRAVGTPLISPRRVTPRPVIRSLFAFCSTMNDAARQAQATPGRVSVRIPAEPMPGTSAFELTFVRFALKRGRTWLGRWMTTCDPTRTFVIAEI